MPHFFNNPMHPYRIIIVHPVKHMRLRSWWERLFSLRPQQKYDVTFRDRLRDGDVTIDHPMRAIYANKATAKKIDQFLAK